MARKTATIVIENGRDKGQRFVVKEMPATEGSVLSFQVFQLLAEAGIDLELKSLDMSGIIRSLMRVVATMSRAEFENYRDWLFKYIEWQSPTDLKTTRKVIIDSDIEDALTIHRLMIEAFKLNLEDVFLGLKQFFPSLK